MSSTVEAGASAATARPAWPVGWKARWIWYRRPPLATLFDRPPLEPEHRDAFMLARRAFDLEAVPGAAPARATADGRYVLWVNGVEARRGPVRSQPGLLYYDELDLAPLLRPGRNVVAALVRHYGAATPWWAPALPYGHLGRGGLILEVAGLAEVSTGPAWRVRRGPWAPGPALVFGPPNENVDARDLPADWLEPGFDDGAWEAAEDVTSAPVWGSPGPAGPGLPAAPFTVADPNPLPPPTDQLRQARPAVRLRSVGDVEASDRRYVWLDPLYASGGRFERSPDAAGALPVRLEAGEAVTFDFGRIVLGIPTVEVESAAGAAVVLRSGELLEDGAPFDRARQWAHRRVCRGGRDRLEPFDIAGLRYLTVAAEAAVTVTEVALRERHYAFPQDGAFGCDDPDLEEIWALGRRTLELCSTDAFLDCPGREQRAWLGDAYVHGLLTYATSADTRLARHALRLGASARHADGVFGMIAAGDLAAEALTIPDYSLHWIRGLARAWEHTGDAELVRDLLPLAQGVLDWFWRHVEGGVLQPLPGWVFIDWYALAAATPNCTVHGLLALALADHARLARQFDQPRAAAESERRAAELREGFAWFWDEARGLYLDEPELGIASQHAQAVAVLADALPRARARDLLAKVCDPEVTRFPVRRLGSQRGWELPDGFVPAHHVLAAQPFFAHWVHQALAAAGRHDLLLESIRRWHRFAQAGDGAVWEFWPGLDDRGSHCHAWAATPTYDLPAHFLGVTPAAPGYAEVSVRPHFGPLRRLEGAVPTPRGPVRVDLRREGDAGPRGTIELPAGTTGRLESEEFPALRRDLAAGANEIR